MDLADLIAKQGSDLRLRQAIVTSVPAGGTCTIRFGDLASTTTADDIPLVRCLSSVVIANGDSVWVLQTGGALLIIGKVGGPANVVVNPAAGQLIQSGSAVGTTNGSGQFDITFPTAFAAPPVVVISHGDLTVQDGVLSLDAGNVYAGSFRVRLAKTDGSGVWVGALIRVNWTAFGTA